MRQVSRGAYLVYCHSHRVYVGFLRRYALPQSEPGWDKKLRSHERSGPSACFAFCRLHPKVRIIYHGHEPEVREACGDGVGVRDQDIGLKDMRGVRGTLTREAYPLEAAVHNIGVMKILQSFSCIRELEGSLAQ